LRTRRIIAKSPNSSSTSADSAEAGDSQAYRCLSRVIWRVRSPSSGTSFHDHVLSGFSQTSHWFRSNAFTLNAVVSLTFPDMGIQSPAFGSWYSGKMRSALS
jgi:hypothetical protein